MEQGNPSAPQGQPIDAAIIASFVKRRAAAGLLVLSWAVALGILRFLGDGERVEPLYARVFMAWVFSTGVALYVIWRCPSCRRYLSGNINARFCPHCSAALKAS